MTVWGVRVDYRVCSMMLKGRVKKKIVLEELYQKIFQEYCVEYNLEITNRLMVYLSDASVLFFRSGTIQIYLKNPEKKLETIREVNKILGLVLPNSSATF